MDESSTSSSFYLPACCFLLLIFLQEITHKKNCFSFKVYSFESIESDAVQKKTNKHNSIASVVRRISIAATSKLLIFYAARNKNSGSETINVYNCSDEYEYVALYFLLKFLMRCRRNEYEAALSLETENDP